MNDNDLQNPLPFKSLAAITEKLLAPTEKQDETGDDDRQPEQQDEQRAGADTEYVEQRLRDLAAFERRAKGGKR